MKISSVQQFAHVIVYFAIFCRISLHLMSGPETFERTPVEAINFQFISLHACTRRALNTVFALAHSAAFLCPTEAARCVRLN